MAQKITLFTIFLLVFLSKNYAQRPEWEIGMFLGGTVYQGDLSQKLLDQAGASLGFTSRYKYYYTLNFRGNVLLSRLKGADEPDSSFTRNFSFESTIVEISGMVEWEPLGRLRELRGGKKGVRFSPYLLGGLGFCFSNPKPSFGTVTDQRTENLIKQDLRSGFSKLLLVIPIGAGVRYDVSRNWMIGVEAAARYPFTDYLDGISQAANPKAGDWYWFYGLTAMYYLN